MSVAIILETLGKLVEVHAELVNISKQKTDIVKEGSVDKLQKLIVTERKQIRLLEQIELKRLKLTEEWFSERKLPLGDATISHILEVLDDEREKEQIAAITTKLTTLIAELKNQEQVNQLLLNQSMQFVQLSLDLISPSIKNLNYGNQNNQSTQTGRSIFDSQA